jgi:hypothetical protein
MASPGRIVAGFGGALALGFVALLLAGALTRTHQLQTLGVLPIYPLAPLEPGQQTCEHEIALAQPIEAVHLNAGSFTGAAGPVAVTVRSGSGRLLGSGRSPRGFRHNGPRVVPVGRVDTPAPVTVCLRNVSAAKLWVFGDSFTQSVRDAIAGVRPTVTPGYSTLHGKRNGDADLSLTFTGREPRSLLARIPSVFRHASLFRPPLVGAWTFWVLLVLMVLVAPLLLVRAMLRAASEEDDERPAPEPERADAPEPARERVPASSSR